MALVIENNVNGGIISKVDPTDEIMTITAGKEALLKLGMKLSLYKVVNKVITQREIVKVTSISANIIGIERAYEACPLNDSATSEIQLALEFHSGDFFSNNLTAEDLKLLEGANEYVENIKNGELLLNQGVTTLDLETDSDGDEEGNENQLARLNVAGLSIGGANENTPGGIAVVDPVTGKLPEGVVPGSAEIVASDSLLLDIGTRYTNSSGQAVSGIVSSVEIKRKGTYRISDSMSYS